MNEKELSQFMSFKKKGEKRIPLFVSQINEKFIIAVYQGSFSKYDILIKYRQKNKYKWSRIRTPKHIHWAVDVLIKMHSDKEKTKQFLDFLIEIWNKTRPFKDDEERKKFLSINYLLESNKEELKNYEDLGEKGEYSIKFLILLAKLLMLQEKTNLETAYMFKKLLDSLKSGEDIFEIVSIATHRGR
jgi:hypothetical protein